MVSFVLMARQFAVYLLDISKHFFGSIWVFCVPDFVTTHGQVLDGFLELADRSTGKPEMILGCCQVAAMVGDLKVPPSLFEMTLASCLKTKMRWIERLLLPNARNIA